MRVKNLVCVLFAVLMCGCLLGSMKPVSAYSEESTGIGMQGFDTTQDVSVSFPDRIVFATDDDLLVYDNDAVLIGTADLPAFESATYLSTVYTTKTRIMYLNSSCVLVVNCGTAKYAVSTTQKVYLMYNFLVYNLYTGVLQTVWQHYKLGGSTDNGPTQLTYFGTGVVMFKFSNATGDFYYMIGEAYLGQNVFAGAWSITYIGKLLSGSSSFTAVGTVVSSGDTITGEEVTYIGVSELVVNATATVSYYTCSYSWGDSGSRANLYRVVLGATLAVTKVGTTALDYTYTGRWQNPSAVHLDGSIFGLGWSYVASSYEYYFLNYVFCNIGVVNEIRIGNLIFNETYVGFIGASMLSSINAYSQWCKPFTAEVPSEGGGVDGTYNVAIWTNIIEEKYLTGIQWSVVGINDGDGDITWSSVEQMYLWTPQDPHTHPYMTTSQLDVGGYQPMGETVGLLMYWGDTRCKADVFVALGVTASTFELLLSGGGTFTGASIAQYPTQITLKQSVLPLYTFTGQLTEGGVLAEGNYTLFATPQAITTVGITSLTYSTLASGSFSGGRFSYTIPAVNVANDVIYRSYKVQVTTVDDVYNVTYLFGWYKLGAVGEGSVNPPYPSPTPVGTYGTGGDGSGLWFDFGDGAGGAYFMVVLMVIGLPAMIMGAVGAQGGWGMQGMVFGLVVGLGSAVSVNLIPTWFVAL